MNNKNNFLKSKIFKIMVRQWFDSPIKVYETIILYKMYFGWKLTNMGFSWKLNFKKRENQNPIISKKYVIDHSRTK